MNFVKWSDMDCILLQWGHYSSVCKPGFLYTHCHRRHQNLKYPHHLLWWLFELAKREIITSKIVQVLDVTVSTPNQTQCTTGFIGTKAQELPTRLRNKQSSSKSASVTEPEGSWEYLTWPSLQLFFISYNSILQFIPFQDIFIPGSVWATAARLLKPSYSKLPALQFSCASQEAIHRKNPRPGPLSCTVFVHHLSRKDVLISKQRRWREK